MFIKCAGKLTAGNQRNGGVAAALLCAVTALAASLADATAVSQRDPVEVARTIVRQHLPPADTADISTFVIAEPLDPRLRLSACHEVPSGRLESNAITRGRALVRVSCRAPVSWNVFVPVRIESEAPVRVLTRSLPRGATVAPADAALQQRRFLGLSENYVKSDEALTGYRLRRPVAAGDVLTRDALEPAPLVLRGSQVTLRAESSGFRIESSGRALADAAAGQRVRVQHAESLKIVEGVVDNVGIVRIGP
jgi:flagella basal body P-ring formation protein FlgA